MKISLIGTGVYGLAIASSLAKNNHDITMWSENPDKIKEYEETKNLKSLIASYEMPRNIKVTGSLAKALENPDIIFITCASKYVSSITNNMKAFYKEDTPICIASKGIEENTCELLSSVVKKNLNAKNVAVISGPTFAIDMINNEPVALALAGTNNKTTDIIQKALAGDTLKLRKSSDMIGVQICGSVKNIIAIASGILGGLGYAESTQAFLINESLHDIKHLIKFLHGKPKTVLSFAGVGDLLMTSMSKKSRNYSFGYVIGSSSQEEVNKYLENNTVEGYHTLNTIIRLLDSKKINIPLIYLINDIVKGNKDPHALADFLVNKK